MEAVRDCEERDNEERIVRRIGLKRGLEGKGVEKAVDDQGFAEALG
jgi:hypothetical protein